MMLAVGFHRSRFYVIPYQAAQVLFCVIKNLPKGKSGLCLNFWEVIVMPNRNVFVCLRALGHTGTIQFRVGALGHTLSVDFWRD